MADLPDHPIPDAYWVRLGQLLAGPYPGSWLEERARARLTKLIEAGVTNFVDLTHPRELDPYALYLPSDVIHQRLSITDMDIPTAEHMTLILDTIDAALDGGQTVYVHCWGGIGRTGTVIGCWLVRHGMAGQDALDEIVRLRGGRLDSPQTEEQHAMVRRWHG
ncbi:MAG: dual specificity protein phosphatase family protein [Anaerolineae bacterium]|nr:dual specificity protein phosphatase family protein [Anaerolineae bacterium]